MLQENFRDSMTETVFLWKISIIECD